MLLVSRLVRVLVFTKQDFVGEGLDLLSFLLFLDFFSLFGFSIYDAFCFLVWSFMIAYIKIHLSRKYNPSIRLNNHCMKFKNWLRFIASSFLTSMLCMSLLRAILYCLNNISLFDISMHGSWIPNGLVFCRWRSNTFPLLLNHYESLTCVRYKNILFDCIISNDNSIFAITAHKTLSRYLSFNI